MVPDANKNYKSSRWLKKMSKKYGHSDEILARQKGTLFDASVVDYFLSWESDIDDSCKFSYVKKKSK